MSLLAVKCEHCQRLMKGLPLANETSRRDTGFLRTAANPGRGTVYCGRFILLNILMQTVGLDLVRSQYKGSYFFIRSYSARTWRSHPYGLQSSLIGCRRSAEMQVSCYRQPSQASFLWEVAKTTKSAFANLLFQNSVGNPVLLEEVCSRSQFVLASKGNDWIHRRQ